ncbi:MAG TPA: hypothetical protein VHR66_18765 [Gemmataceae bacterium]|nr:hypothetical protein [Gemmataceae bacterium]
MARLFLAALALTFAMSAYAADEALQPILDMYKSGKLIDRGESKTVRSAAAHLFEARHADDIKEVFGSDFMALTAWLDKQKDLKEEFYSAIHPQKDDVSRVLAIFRALWKADADAVAKYPNLAIAVSVVWDDPKNVYDYRPHAVRTKSTMPETYLGHGAKEEFAYHVSHAKSIQGKEGVARIEVLPWEFLVYVVDHRTPVDERDWAVKGYLPKRPMIGKIYHEVEYDEVMLQTQSKVCKLNGHDYSLQEIRKVGGVCAMQADFAARVGKSLAVPAAFVGGQSQDLGLHAWVMWVEVKSASKTNVNFQLESWGRYRGDNYYTGEVTDPQTGEEILDRDMERRLSAAATNRTGKRHSDLVMSFYPDVVKAAELDVKKKVQYLLGALKLSVFNEAAWLELARMCKAGEITADSKTLVLEQAEFLLTGFAKYPDFSWKVAGDLMTVQTDATVRNRFFERLAILYETANRPDLCCEARLKWADFLGESKAWTTAAVGLSATIKKFPDEGRYVPKMLDKLKDVCGQFNGGKEYMSKTYLELMRKVNPKRGDEITKYFIKLSADALAFFQAEKKTKEVAEIEGIRQRVGVKSN